MCIHVLQQWHNHCGVKGGRVLPLTVKKLPKIGEKREKIRKKWENQEKRGKIEKVLSLCPSWQIGLATLQSIYSILKTDGHGFKSVWYSMYNRICIHVNADVNGHLELNLLKDRQRFDTIWTSNHEVYKFRDWWIFTYFIFGHGESSPNNIWIMVNFELTCIFLFYYFLYLKVNLDLGKTNQLGESSPNFIFAVVNLDPIILEERWIDGESWSNDFVEKVNRCEDLRWVGSRCPLMYA